MSQDEEYSDEEYLSDDSCDDSSVRSEEEEEEPEEIIEFVDDSAEIFKSPRPFETLQTVDGSQGEVLDWNAIMEQDAPAERDESLFNYLPVELRWLVFQADVDMQSLRTCRLVCKEWNKTIASAEFWHSYIVRHGSADVAAVSARMMDAGHKSTILWPLQAIKEACALVPAIEMDICHMNDKHWKHKQHPEAKFSPIAYLKSVCWLEITFFKVLKAGKYDVLWHMFLKNSGSANFDCNWTVSDQDGMQIFQRSTPRNSKIFAQRAHSKFFVWKMGTINVAKEQNIKFWNQGGNNGWFGGWGISHVEIRPLLE